MSSTPLHAVTGAFGFSGKYIARRLLDRGQRVITLTNSIDRANAFGGEFLRTRSTSTDLTSWCGRSLASTCSTIPTGCASTTALHPRRCRRNTLVLFDAASRPAYAARPRQHHQPSEDSPLEYFRGKARLERGLRESGLSYAILRPTVLFGKEDILINNIAWALRRLPVFGVFGDGSYRLQPIYVDDLAESVCGWRRGAGEHVVNAIGPETFTYRGMAETIARLIGVRRPILPVPPALGYLAGRAIGAFTGDVIITREEIAGLMAGLLCVDTPPTGTTRLTDWITEHAATLGRRYTSELARRRDRRRAIGATEQMSFPANAIEAVAEFTIRLDGRGDPKTKAWWEGYMKGVIPFRGIKMPILRDALLPWWRERVAPEGLTFERRSPCPSSGQPGRRISWRVCWRSRSARGSRPPTWPRSRRSSAKGCSSTGTTPTGFA